MTIAPDDLPGALRCLAAGGSLDPHAADLRRLAALVAAVPDAFAFRVGAHQRLDQIGWPVARDLAIAVAAFARVAVPHPLVDATLASARAVVRDAHTDRDPHARQRSRLDMLALAARGHSAADLIALSAHLPGPPDPGLHEFLARHAAWATEHPDHAALLAALAGATVGVIDGWLSYHAHRRLPSLAAECAARVVAGSAALAGPAVLDEIVALALALAALPPVPPDSQ